MALRDFNDGDLRGCHYTLEKLYVESKGAKKHYIQGIVQIIAAIFKVKMQPNRESAMRLLRKGMSHLEDIKSEDAEIDVARLIADARMLLSALEEAGIGKFRDIPEELFPKMHLRNL